MTLQPNILWFLPTHGDGRHLGTSIGGRELNFTYLRQIAQPADQLGYTGVLLPTGRSCEDSWIVASALAPLTERLKFLVRVRPGLQVPSVAGCSPAKPSTSGVSTSPSRTAGCCLRRCSRRVHRSILAVRRMLASMS